MNVNLFLDFNLLIRHLLAYRFRYRINIKAFLIPKVKMSLENSMNEMLLTTN